MPHSNRDGPPGKIAGSSSLIQSKFDTAAAVCPPQSAHMAALPRPPHAACPLAERPQALRGAHFARKPPQWRRRLTTTAALAELQPWVLPAAGLGVAAAG